MMQSDYKRLVSLGSFNKYVEFCMQSSCLKMLNKPLLFLLLKLKFLVL